MIIYVVLDESGRSIQAVFHDYHQAAMYCAVREEDYVFLKEFDTEDIKLECKREVKAEWTATVANDTEIIHLEKSFTFYGVNAVEDNETCDGIHDYYVSVVLGLDSTKEEAEKAILESYAKWQQEQ